MLNQGSSKRAFTERPPDFLCVGAQKAGTTWVYVVLRESAGVFVPAIKESNYLLEAQDQDRAWARRYRLQQVEHMRRHYRTNCLAQRNIASILDQIEHIDTKEVDDDWYRTVFSYARDDEAAGEVCPSYMCMSSVNIDHAVRLNPDLRVLVLVRDPVDRFWSQIRMNTRYGLIEQPIDELLHDERALHIFMKFSDYAGSIERWANRLRPGRLQTLIYDDITHRPRELAGEILGFLGVKPGLIRGYETRVNIGQRLPMTPAQHARVYELMQPQYAYLRGIFPDVVDRWQARHEQALEGSSRLSA